MATNQRKQWHGIIKQCGGNENEISVMKKENSSSNNNQRRKSMASA